MMQIRPILSFEQRLGLRNKALRVSSGREPVILGSRALASLICMTLDARIKLLSPIRPRLTAP